MTQYNQYDKLIVLMCVLIRKVNTMIINLESNTEKKISDIAESLDIIESLARILIECKKNETELECQDCESLMIAMKDRIIDTNRKFLQLKISLNL